MTITVAGGLIQLSGSLALSPLWIDLITIPLFSAAAGVLVNWSGIFMLFSPVNFHGVYLPGVKTLFPFLPRRIQVLPLWAPGGIIGYQGFIPARGEKMAAMVVHNVVSKIGTPKDFVAEFAEASVIAHLVDLVNADLRPLVTRVMESEHPELWSQMSPGIRDMLIGRIEARMPWIAARAVEEGGDNADQLLDLRLLAVRVLTDRLDILNDVAKKLAGPEIRLMIRIGLLGLPFGLLLVLILHSYRAVPIFNHIPSALVIIVGAMLIGMTVNLIAIKVAFEPAEPAPRYRYPWRQASLAKRQNDAAEDFGQMLANDILTIDNITRELLHGPRGDRTAKFIEHLVADEVDQILGVLKKSIQIAVGPKEFQAVLDSSSAVAADYTTTLVGKDEAFMTEQRARIAQFGTQKLRALPAKEFVDVIYAMIEQDAWLLYVHGAALGALVGIAHIALFGA
ncbi:hypothetical protein [Mycobacterium sp. SM3041]|uniref:hypothetical protein n=1 Tax=Mycobacterium sp. SM3041 TaxID=3114291 RepID=UPI003204AF18